MERRAVLVGGPFCGEKILVDDDVELLHMIMQRGDMEDEHFYIETRLSDLWEDVVVYEYIGQEEAECHD